MNIKYYNYAPGQGFVTIFDLVWSFFVTFFELNVTRCYLKLRLFLFFVTRVSLSISEATGAPSTTLFKQKKRILAKRERGAQIHPKSAELLHQAGRGGQNHLPTFAHCLPVFYDSIDDKESSTHTKSMDKYEKWFNFSPVSVIWPMKSSSNDYKLTSNDLKNTISLDRVILDPNDWANHWAESEWLMMGKRSLIWV